MKTTTSLFTKNILKQQNILFKTQLYSFSANYFKKVKNPTKIYKYRRYDGSYEKEKEEFIKKFKDTRKELIDTFWKEHSVVEQEYLRDFYEGNLELKKENQIKDVDFIISQSWKCAKETAYRKEAHDRFYAKQAAWRYEDSLKKQDLQGLFNIMDKQAENWLTTKNFSQKIPYVIDELLPPTVISHNDYYKKLSDYALLVDLGKLEEAENFRRGDLNIEEKNSFLGPLYDNLKKMIKNVSKTNENKYIEAFSILEAKIKSAYNIENGKGKEIHSIFKKLFKRMVDIQRELNEKDSYKLNAIENTLSNLMNLIITWNKYVEILYITSDEMKKEGDKYNISNHEVATIQDYENDYDILDTNSEDYVNRKKFQFLNNISSIDSKFNNIFNTISVNYLLNYELNFTFTFTISLQKK